MTLLTTADRRAYQSNIWKAYLFHFLMNFQLWWAIWVLYLKDLRGLSFTQITILEALFFSLAILAELPTGAVADRFGRRQSLVLGAAFSAAGVFIFGLADSYGIILTAYLAWALGIAFLSGAEHALIFDSLKVVGREGEFQRVAGRMAAIFSFGVLAGGLVGAPIAAATDLSIPILLSAAISLPGVLVALSMREPPLPHGETLLAYAQLLRESVRTATRLPPVWTMLVLSSLLIAFTMATSIVFMQPFLTGHGVDVGFVGFLQAPEQVFGIAGALVAYQVVARTGTRGVFLAVPLVMVSAYVILGAWDSVYAFAAFPLIAFMNQLLLPTATDYLNRRIPSNQRATILSVRTMLMSVWVVTLEPVLGVTADAMSIQAVFWVAAGVAGVAFTLALALWLRADSREGEGAERPQVPPK